MKTLAVILLSVSPLLAADANELAKRLRELDPQVIPAAERDAAVAALRNDQRERLQEANRKSTEEWRAVRNREDWEQLAQRTPNRLDQGLPGDPSQPPEKPQRRVTGTVPGDRFRIENIVFEGRSGWSISGNLYLPDPLQDKMPAILISHSHHTPKEHGELQDMGMTWARAGCAVLVIDHLGHGERRQHPFKTAADFPESFRVSRQDYYFRYDTSLHLALAGQTLMGWMVHDLKRAIDLLVDTPGVDPQKIILLGSVAGGGDPAAVTAAVDERIAALVPFNFGGPQPETRYPLPDNAEETFNYAGSGSWESTRNLSNSASYHRFLPWEIVASIAPRKLIHAHEFRWDRERDPVWKRYQTIWKLYDAADSLDFTHGSGSVSDQSPKSTHCTHIGKVHRERIHQAFEKWFGIRAVEYSQRVDSGRLRCFTPEVVAELRPKVLREAVGEIAREASTSTRQVGLIPESFLLWGLPTGPFQPLRVRPQVNDVGPLPQVRTTRIVLEIDHGILVPILLFEPEQATQPPSLALGLAFEGKAGFLKHRSDDIAALLTRGIAVCLCDVRGTGETLEDAGRGRESTNTARSSTEWILGRTLLGMRLYDVMWVVEYLIKERKYDRRRIALWGESFVPPSSPEGPFTVPHGVEKRPRQPEPLGGVLALLAVRFVHPGCVYIRGGLSDYASALDESSILIPHDAILPGILNFGDLPGLLALRPLLQKAPLPVRLDKLVDAQNRLLAPDDLRRRYTRATESYAKHKAEGRLVLDGEDPVAAWFAAHLGR